MNGTKKSAYFHNDLFRYIKTVMKREGFNFSQTLNWIVRKAMNEDKGSD